MSSSGKTPTPQKLRPRDLLRHDAFEDLSDPEVLYQIGLIVADGAIIYSTKGYSLRVKVALSDAELIYRLQRFLNAPDSCLYDKPPEEEGHEPQKGLQVHSKRIVTSLMAVGLVQRKSFVGMKAHAALAGEAAFWLGVLDGDGSVSFTTKNRGPRIEMAGCEGVLRQFATWGAKMTNRLEAPAVKPRKKDASWRTYFLGLEARHIAQLLLDSLPQSLARKRRSLEKAASWFPSGGGYLHTNFDVRLEDTPSRQRARRLRARRRLLWSEAGRHDSSHFHAAFVKILRAKGYRRLKSRLDLSTKRTIFEAELEGRTVLVCGTTSQSYLLSKRVQEKRQQGMEVYVLHLSPGRNVHYLHRARDGTAPTRIPLAFLKSLAPWPSQAMTDR